MKRPPVPLELERAYLTSAEEALAGEIRVEPEDFLVDEVPLYEPSGAGEHLYLRIEKRGIPTKEVVRRLSRRLRVPQRSIGTAGLKDANAVARQTISVFGVQDAALEGLEDAQFKILDATPHKNKLKPGHLRGNRFSLRIRGGGQQLDLAQRVLNQLTEKGVANYFGLQRFGRERSTHRLGQALVAEDAEAFLELLLLGSRRSQGEAALISPLPRLNEAREACVQQNYEAAAALFPSSCSSEAAACRSLLKGKSLEQAVRGISVKQRSFYVAAFQSLLFNTYLTRRLDRISQLEVGEVVTLHRNGAAFLVEELETEQARCDSFEISPSGPSFGQRLLRPQPGSSALEVEDQILAELAPGLGPELSKAFGAKPLGQRRPLRIQLSEVEVEGLGDDLRVAFFLPKGCYATVVLEELFKRQTD